MASSKKPKYSLKLLGIPTFIYIILIFGLTLIHFLITISHGSNPGFINFYTSIFLFVALVNANRKDIKAPKNDLLIALQFVVSLMLWVYIFTLITFIYNDYLTYIYKPEPLNNNLWHNFSDNKLSILLPKEPTVDKRVLPVNAFPTKFQTMETEYISNPNSEIGFVIHYFDFPKGYDLSNPNSLLGDETLSYEYNSGNLITSSSARNFIFQNHPTTDISLKLANNYYSKCRLMIVGSTFYQLCAGSQNQYALSNGDYEKFINSFQPL